MIWFFIAASRVSFVQDPLVTIEISHRRAILMGRRTPIGQLVVPHQVMASHHLSICLGQSHNGVALFESESILRRFGCIPLDTISYLVPKNGRDYLLRVTRGELSEVIRIIKFLHIRSVGQVRVIRGGAEKLQSFSHSRGVQTGFSTMAY